jgi:hypothetical protein
MIDALSLPPTTPIFTWISDRGENINIHSSALRECCLHYRPQVINVAIDHDLAATFLKHNIINAARIAQLANRYLHEPVEPILFCEHRAGNPDALLVDGHHRYYLAHTYNSLYLRAWMIPEEAWRPFTLKNVPNITRQQLRDLPTTKRTY